MPLARPPVVIVAPLLPASDVKHHVLGLHWDDPGVRVGVWAGRTLMESAAERSGRLEATATHHK